MTSFYLILCTLLDSKTAGVSKATGSTDLDTPKGAHPPMGFDSTSGHTETPRGSTNNYFGSMKFQPPSLSSGVKIKVFLRLGGVQKVPIFPLKSGF